MLGVLSKIPQRLLSVETSFHISSLIREVTKEKFEVKFVRSSGAGGQNVNKVNTKTELRLDLSTANWIPTEVLIKLKEQENNSVNKEGELIVVSEKTRSQHQNLQDALNKVKEMLRNASHQPKETSEETKGKVEQFKRREKEKRLELKKRKSLKKFDRKNID
ncbi:large ribosomal subunit protein mL62-like [Clytia hemisphaerica]|uniref:large ribosomal subunit protein mL62-like n=1 Tax=Clytia hemisphaerica TaxID=252671 RepID=UPI0034D3BADD